MELTDLVRHHGGSMSYVLKQNNVQLTLSNSWNPNLFGRITGTSYPAEVSQDYIWEQDGYWLGWIADPEPIQPTQEELDAQAEEQKQQNRYNAYITESDPLFFKWQRGEIQKQIWLDKVAEIKTRYA